MFIIEGITHQSSFFSRALCCPTVWEYCTCSAEWWKKQRWALSSSRSSEIKFTVARETHFFLTQSGSFVRSFVLRSFYQGKHSSSQSDPTNVSPWSPLSISDDSLSVSSRIQTKTMPSFSHSSSERGKSQWQGWGDGWQSGEPRL
jgi:hypothetical protein